MVTETQASQAPEVDPYDSAMSAEARPATLIYFGQVDVDIWYCILQRGMGKVPFDAGQHSADQRRTAIDLSLTPIQTGSYTVRPVKRDIIAESRDWTQIVRPSLQTLGVDLRGLKGRYAQIQIVPNGQTYLDKTTGEKKDSTTIKFLTVYNSESECIAAREALFGTRQDATTTAAAPANATTSRANDAEKTSAAKFLPALVKIANGDMVKLEDMLKKNELTNRHFTIASPEILELIAPF